MLTKTEYWRWIFVDNRSTTFTWPFWRQFQHPYWWQTVSKKAYDIKYSSFLKRNSIKSEITWSFKVPKNAFLLRRTYCRRFCTFLIRFRKSENDFVLQLNLIFLFARFREQSDCLHNRNEMTSHTHFLTYTELSGIETEHWYMLAICLFLSHCCPLLRWARVFGEAWSLPEVSSSLKSTPHSQGRLAMINETHCISTSLMFCSPQTMLISELAIFSYNSFFEP